MLIRAAGAPGSGPACCSPRVDVDAALFQARLGHARRPSHRIGRRADGVRVRSAAPSSKPAPSAAGSAPSPAIKQAVAEDSRKRVVIVGAGWAGTLDAAACPALGARAVSTPSAAAWASLNHRAVGGVPLHRVWRCKAPKRAGIQGHAAGRVAQPRRAQRWLAHAAGPRRRGRRQGLLV